MGYNLLFCLQYDIKDDILFLYAKRLFPVF
jgi:hypothetical protein